MEVWNPRILYSAVRKGNGALVLSWTRVYFEIFKH